MNYKTQMDAAKKGILTKEMKTVAQKEFMDETKLMELVASGRVAIPANIRHTSLSAEGIGEGLKTKINVNLGISGDCIDYTNEMNKVKLAIDFGAEAIMDLSNYGKTHDFRKELIAYSPAMIGTVPMYDAIGYLEKDLMDIKAKDFLKVVQAHAEEGVDFMTIHSARYLINPQKIPIKTAAAIHIIMIAALFNTLEKTYLLASSSRLSICEFIL